MSAASKRWVAVESQFSIRREHPATFLARWMSWEPGDKANNEVQADDADFYDAF